MNKTNKDKQNRDFHGFSLLAKKTSRLTKSLWKAPEAPKTTEAFGK